MAHSQLLDCGSLKYFNLSLQDAVVFSPTSDLQSSFTESPSDPSKRVCDYSTYMQLLQENAELHRSNRLLQALASSKSASAEKELVDTEIKIAEAKIKDLEAILNGQNVDLTLVEEKRHLQHLNVGLSEKVAALQVKEARILSELQDSKDKSELLEFRVLELEEEQEKVKVPSSNWTFYTKVI